MKHQDGFSLIEILVVLVIMGLLISVVAPTVLNSADDARIQKVQADFKAIETALKIYRLDNYVYPTTEQGLMALVEPSTLTPTAKNIRLSWAAMALASPGLSKRSSSKIMMTQESSGQWEWPLTPSVSRP